MPDYCNQYLKSISCYCLAILDLLLFIRFLIVCVKSTESIEADQYHFVFCERDKNIAYFRLPSSMTDLDANQILQESLFAYVYKSFL